jgi:glutathione peroxidase-family protein
MKIISALIIVLFLNVFIFPQEAKLNEQAPDFKLLDSNGKEHSINEYRGKTMVLEWINFECPFVKKHYDSRNMQSLQLKYTRKDVVWLLINSSAEGKQGNFSNEEINSRIKSLNANISAYLIDTDGRVGKTYGAKTTPHMYIINKEGKLVYAGGIDDKATTDVGDIKEANNYISLALDELLSGKSVSIQTSKPYGCSVKY